MLKLKASVKWEVISEDDEHKVNKGVVVKVEKEPVAESGDISLETSIQDQQSLDIGRIVFNVVIFANYIVEFISRT